MSVELFLLVDDHNGNNFADSLFKCIFNEEVWILIKMSVKFIPESPIDYKPALF